MEEQFRRGGPHRTPGTAPSFGQLLQRSRALARLTQEELAGRSGYSTDYISKLERDQRRPPLGAVERLVRVLDLGERERGALLAARVGNPTSQPADRPPEPAPPPTPPTPLVGRVAEQAAVHTALGLSRLVTLTGVGGTGKTRLALAVAHAAATNGSYADGVAFVECAPLREAGLLAASVGRALGLVDQPGLTPEAHLVQVLHARHLLLVVDNLEHLLQEAVLLGRLLAAAPRLHVLATSRAPLRLYGEHEVRVPPLSLPVPDAGPGGDDPAASEAVQLFVARARAAAPLFAATGSTLAAVASICVALDGLPLAIELAAARVSLFSPEALLPRLGERLVILTGGPRDRPQRQQTLRAALDWSYALLTPAERTLFGRLGVFAGSFDAAAAAVICAPVGTQASDLAGGFQGPSTEIGVERMLAQLEALVDQSLVEVAPGATPRFRVLETVREYALTHLMEEGAAKDVRHAHLRYYRAVAETLSEGLRGPEQGACLARLEAEHDNLRAALGWACECGEAGEGLRLAGALGRFWRLHGHLREGRSWLEALLGVPNRTSHAVRAQALISAGTLAWRLGEYARATSALTEALGLFRQVGDASGIAGALNTLGNVAYRQGDYGRAAAAYTEALASRRRAGDLQGVSVALGNLGRVALQQGDTAHALTVLEETLALKRQLGDTRGIAGTLTSLGRVAARRGDFTRATSLFEESLVLKQTLGDRHGRVTTLVQLGAVARSQGDCARALALLREAVRLGQEIGAGDRVAEALEGLAAVAAADGRSEVAARVGGAADALRASLGLPLTLDQQSSHDEMVRLARGAVGDAAFAAAWAVGAEQSVEKTIAAVLQLNSPAWRRGR